MASIACDLCGEEQAVMMQTNLGDGSTLAAGANCLLLFTLGTAVTYSAGMPADVAAAYHDLLAALISNLNPSMLQLAKTAVPKPPRRRKGPGEPSDGAEAVSGDGSEQNDGGESEASMAASGAAGAGTE